jgi:predicted Zn-dependent protease
LRSLDAGAKYGPILPFSRKQESEADHTGLLHMACAGYGLHEAVAF